MIKYFNQPIEKKMEISTDSLIQMVTDDPDRIIIDGIELGLQLNKLFNMILWINPATETIKAEWITSDEKVIDIPLEMSEADQKALLEYEAKYFGHM